MSKLLKHDFFKKLDIENTLDSLTGAVSRKYMISYINHLIENNKQFSLVIFDIDNFKDFNDTYGHLTGDEVLIRTIKEVKNVLDDTDTIGRYGGDEFLIVFEGIVDYETKWTKLKSVIKAIREPYISNGRRLLITSTFGCASYPVDDDSYVGLFDKIDKTLYRGKDKGRNCFVIYSKEKHENLIIKNREKQYVRMESLRVLLAKNIDKQELIYEALLHAANYLGVDRTGYFIDGKQISTYSKDEFLDLEPIDLNECSSLFEGNIMIVNDKSLVENDYLKEYSERNNLRSFLVIKLITIPNAYIIACSKSYKVWQESEIALSLYLLSLVEGKNL